MQKIWRRRSFSGGLIGEKINPAKYKGNLNQTPVFIGISDDDPHIPLQRVYETEKIFRQLNAEILVKEYTGKGHTVIADELETAKFIYFK
ncbi:MAG: hypothetical protein HC906_08995 [Bacteroidales bacterium]|nr:hypothetical protein [Bacteroidales bacterium]